MNILSILFSPYAHPGILAGGTLIFFILGWLWYNPITPIGKIWIRYFPMPEKMPRPKEFIVMMIFQLFMGYVVTHTVMVIWEVLGYVTQTMIIDCIGTCPISGKVSVPMSEMFRTIIIAKIYFGFVLIKDLGHWYFERKPFALVLIGVGYYFVGILGVCGLLAWFF